MSECCFPSPPHYLVQSLPKYGITEKKLCSQVDLSSNPDCTIFVADNFDFHVNGMELISIYIVFHLKSNRIMNVKYLDAICGRVDI